MANTISKHKVPGWTTLLGVGLFCGAVLVLHHLLGRYHWHDILAHVHAISPRKIARAAIFSLAGYSCLSLYDALAVRFAGARVAYPRVALISFMGYAIGHTVGFNTLTGGAVRYRAYSALGLSGGQIATIIAFGTFTFFLGAGVLLGLSLVTQAGMSGSALHVHAWLSKTVGSLLLAAVLFYLWLVCTRHQPLRLGKFEIPIPKPRVALSQIAIGCTDLLCAAAVLFVLLPPHTSVTYGAFAGIYLIALAAGVVSNVPGGIGVFEFVLVLLLPSVPKDQLLGALVAYRAIYYFAPFTIALVLLGGHELWAHRGPAVRFIQLVRTFLIAVTPQAIGIAVFLAGAVLLFSGATPGLGTRIALLRNFVPLPILELSHLLGSAVGVGLLVLAHGLYKRLRTAWWLTIWLLCAGVLLSLLKGFDYEEATVLAIVVVLLASARNRFRRRASLLEQHYSGPWIAALCIVLLSAALLVIFAYRNLRYDNEMWWQFAFHASAPRSLRGMLIALIVAAVYALWRVLRPARPPFAPPRPEDLEAAAALVERSDDTTSNLALLGDKNLLFNGDRSACIMFQVSGSSWVAMGDPIGEHEAGEELAWRFLENCDAMAVSPVFYQVTPDHLPLYIDLGLSLSKLGEEARVPLAEFSLDGPARADLRQAHRRAIRDGATFEMLPRGAALAIMPELRAVSDAWLEEKKTAEKRFSLGYFDERYLSYFDIAVVRRDGAVVAFSNIWRGGKSELSVDLMRFTAAAPKGVMDYMLIECMLWGKAHGFECFNLGMAPLSGLEEHALAPAWHKLGRMVQRYGEMFYNFEGLRKYKEKFSPVWRPRYLAAPDGLALAGALLDVTALISGGVRKALQKMTLARMALLLAVLLSRAMQAHGAAPVPAALADLPLIVTSAPEASASPWFAVLLSGDGGWTGIDRALAQDLLRHDISVVGWDALQYFWHARTPEGAARDLDRVMQYFASHWQRSRVLLIGFSQGADTLPFMVNRLSPASRELLGFTALLALSETAVFHIRLRDLLGRHDVTVPTAPELARWSGGPYLCTFGSRDPDAACDRLAQPPGSALKLEGGHHFGGHYHALAMEILQRLPAH